MVRNEMKKNCNTAKKMYNKIIKKRNGEKKKQKQLNRKYLWRKTKIKEQIELTNRLNFRS